MDITHQPHSLLLPEEISRDYEILRLLGKGGMGEVYLARQIRVGGRLVALKILNRSFSEEPEIVRRFENEAAIAGLLNHHNIVSIYDCRVASNGQICVAMEYVEGKTLRALIDEQGSFSLDQAVGIAIQLCEGLSALHRLGIIHRDIKADNVMVSQEGDQMVAKILDFGIARLTGDASLTSSGVILGSAAYMSPEQAEGLSGDQIDARTDIYSLGMVIYKMLTGKVAFGGGSWTSIIYKQIREAPAPIRSVRPDIPESIERVILKALEKDRSRRQQSIEEFSRELQIAYEENALTDKGRLIHIGVPMANTLPNTQRATRTLKHQRIKKSLRKVVLGIIIGIISGLIVAVLGYFAVEKAKTLISPPLATNLVEYRIKPEKPSSSYDTLPPGNRIHSGDTLSFQVRLAHTGTIYLLQQSADGSLKWMNPVANNQAQIGRDGEWLRIPDQEFDWVGVQKDTGPERFLLLYVPMGVNWSLTQAVLPQVLTIKNGFPTISPDAAARIQKYIKANGIEMASSTSQVDRIISHELRAVYTGNQIAFHELKLDYEP